MNDWFISWSAKPKDKVIPAPPKPLTIVTPGIGFKISSVPPFFNLA